jgi:hypothetical protein
VFVRPLSRLELHEWKGKCSGITCFKKNGFVQFVLSCATLGFDQRFRSQKWRKLSAGSTVLSTSLTRNSVSLPPLPVSSISDAYSLTMLLQGPKGRRLPWHNYKRCGCILSCHRSHLKPSTHSNYKHASYQHGYSCSLSGH